MLAKFLEKRRKQKAHEDAKADFREAGISSRTSEANAAAHRVLDTIDNLSDGQPKVGLNRYPKWMRIKDIEKLAERKLAR